MASVGHIAVGLAAGRYCARYDASSFVRLSVALAALALLPDADVVPFAMGVPYEAPWGHRGASHSLLAAVIVAAVVAWCWPALGRERRARWFVVVALVVSSHGLLDALTDGGLGVALAWPWSEARHFAPWRPLPVAPIGLRLLSFRGLELMVLEALTFAPLWLYALWPRRAKEATSSKPTRSE